MADLLLHTDELALQLPGGFRLGPVNLHLYSGKMYGLLGANGAGKSTLLKLLAGLISPDQGQIQLCQQPLQSLTPTLRARQLAYLSQHQAQAAMTVRQLLALGLVPHKALWQGNTAADETAITKVLQQTGLQHKAELQLAQLSGGEQQRAHIGRVLVQQARLLLLDEPVNHLDIHYQHQILASLRRSGLCVLASFHDINLAAAYCDELILLHQGTVLAAGATADVLQPDLLQQVFGRPCHIDHNPFSAVHRVTFAPEPL